VDLPKEYKLTPPRYQALTRENIPVLPFSGGKIRPFSGHVSAIDGTGQILTATGIAETHSRVDIYDVIFDHS
jgi:redox-sensitive bicupin YhaK (pirin superfamily)